MAALILALTTPLRLLLKLGKQACSLTPGLKLASSYAGLPYTAFGPFSFTLPRL